MKNISFQNNELFTQNSLFESITNYIMHISLSQIIQLIWVSNLCISMLLLLIHEYEFHWIPFLYNSMTLYTFWKALTLQHSKSIGKVSTKISLNIFSQQFQRTILVLIGIRFFTFAHFYWGQGNRNIKELIQDTIQSSLKFFMILAFNVPIKQICSLELFFYIINTSLKIASPELLKLFIIQVPYMQLQILLIQLVLFLAAIFFNQQLSLRSQKRTYKELMKWMSKNNDSAFIILKKLKNHSYHCLTERPQDPTNQFQSKQNFKVIHANNRFCNLFNSSYQDNQKYLTTNDKGLPLTFDNVNIFPYNYSYQGHSSLQSILQEIFNQMEEQNLGEYKYTEGLEFKFCFCFLKDNRLLEITCNIHGNKALLMFARKNPTRSRSQRVNSRQNFLFNQQEEEIKEPQFNDISETSKDELTDPQKPSTEHTFRENCIVTSKLSQKHLQGKSEEFKHDRIHSELQLKINQLEATNRTLNRQHSLQKAESDNLPINRIKELERQLNNNKIFLNMVIHDMRNPTTAIESALKELLKLLMLDRKTTAKKMQNLNMLTNQYLRAQLDQEILNSLGQQKPIVSVVSQQYQEQQFSPLIQEDPLQNSNLFNYNFKRTAQFKELRSDDQMPSYIIQNDQFIQQKDEEQYEMATENIPTSQSIHNIPYNLDPKTGSILQQESKAPKVFIQRHNEVFNPLDIMQSRSPKLTKLNQNQETQGQFSFMQERSQQHRNLHNSFQIRENMLKFRRLNSHQQERTNSEHEHMAQGLWILYEQLQEDGVVMNEQLSNEVESLLKNSLFSSTMLLNLINDLLDLAKIENSQFNFHDSYFNLFEIIIMALDNLEFQAQQKQIQLVHQYKEEEIGYFMQIHGDKNRYLQILLNFLSNAIKFTPKGGLIIVETIVQDTQDMQSPHKNEFFSQDKVMNDLSVECKKSQRSKSLNNQDQIVHKSQIEVMLSSNSQFKYIGFQIRIKDSGCGISSDNLDKLFMNFSRLEEHKKDNPRGTGLGLSICKSLVELMGGSVCVESLLNQGTTFVVKINAKCQFVPIQEAIDLVQALKQKSRTQWSRSKENQQPTIDNYMQFLSQVKIMESQGVECLKINAKHTYLEEESKHDGIENSQINSRAHNPGSHSPQPFKQSWFEVKPIATCLVANDNMFQLMMISKIIQQFNIKVDEAENGLVAVQKALCNTYDFIVLDLDMPIMNGYDACKRIKQNAQNEIQQLFQINKKSNTSKEDLNEYQENTPLIVALSALINDSVIEEGLKVGFDDFLESPLDVNQLQTRILNRIKVNMKQSAQKNANNSQNNVQFWPDDEIIED